MRLMKTARFGKFFAMVAAFSLCASLGFAQLGLSGNPAGGSQALGQSGTLSGFSSGVANTGTGGVGPTPGGSFINNYLFQDEQVNLSANAGNVRVLRTDQKAHLNDFVTATFPIKNVTPRELRNVMRTIVGLEGGRAEVILDKDGKENFLQVIAPDFMMPYIKEAVPLLDEKWVREFDTGSADVRYGAKNRSAADIDFIASQYASGSGFSVVDTRANAVSRIDEPYRIENYLKGAAAVDIPANQVSLDITIYEISSQNDLKIGLDYINWKNGPGRNLAQFIYQGADANSRQDLLTSVFDPFLNAGSAALGGGDTVKLLTDFDQTYEAVNYVLSSNFIDFLQVKGKARVVKKETLTVKSANVATLQADDQIVALVNNPTDGSGAIAPSIAGVRLTGVGTNPFPLDETRAPGGQNLVDIFRPDGTPVRSRVTIDPVRDSSRRLNNAKAGRAGIFIGVVPFVGLASMELFMEIEVADLNGVSAAGLPVINTRTLTNTVRLLDGEPYVVGAIKRTHDIKETAKAPGLGDLPILGYLFGGEQDLKRTSDIIITVTPHFYTSAQTDLHLPQNVKHLADIVEGREKTILPHSHLGYDQWLLDPARRN